MTARVDVPALETPSLQHCSELRRGGLLRSELGFDGAIVSDALEMKAISANISIKQVS